MPVRNDRNCCPGCKAEKSAPPGKELLETIYIKRRTADRTDPDGLAECIPHNPETGEPCFVLFAVVLDHNPVTAFAKSFLHDRLLFREFIWIEIRLPGVPLPCDDSN